MIFKVATDAGWKWIDGIERVETFGYLTNRKATDESMAMNFWSFDDLADAINRTWGDAAERSFESEIWPSLGETPLMVQAIVLTRANHEAVLALVSGPAFLLTEKGDTVDRLAF